MSETESSAMDMAKLALDLPHTVVCENFINALERENVAERLRYYPNACIGGECIDVRLEAARNILAGPFFAEYASGASRGGELMALDPSVVDVFRTHTVALTMRERRVAVPSSVLPHQPPGENLPYQSAEAAVSTSPGG